MGRGNMRGGRGRGGRGGGGLQRNRGGPGGPGFRGGRQMGYHGPPPAAYPGYNDGYQDYYNYGPPMMPPMPPPPPIVPRNMRGMGPNRRAPMMYGAYGPPVPPLPPPRPPRGFGGMMGPRGRGGKLAGRILKSKNAMNGARRGGKKDQSERIMNVESKKPWVTPELAEQIKKKYELLKKQKANPSDQDIQKQYNEQNELTNKMNAELRSKYTKEQELSKPWVGESLKAEIEKKYQLYEDARAKKDDEAAWTAFKEQKALVTTMFQAARTEFVTNTPEEDLSKMDENFAADVKLNGM